MNIMKLEEHLYFPSGFKNVVLYGKTTFSVGQVQERQQELGHEACPALGGNCHLLSMAGG